MANQFEEKLLELNSAELFDKIENYILSTDSPIIKFNIKNPLLDNNLDSLLMWVITQRQGRSCFDAETDILYSYPYFHSSITDIFKITKYYRPETRILDVYSSLLQRISDCDVRSWICKDIKKRTYDPVESMGGFNSAPIDEFGVRFPTLPKYYGYGTTNDSSNLNFLI